jgi:hypothetical protein
MRHLGSLVLSLIIGVLSYVLAGIGIVKYVEAQEDLAADRAIGYLPLVLAITLLVAAGGLYSVLVLARLSPLGPVLLSFALFGLAMWSMFDLEGFDDVMPNGILGVDNALIAPAGPVSLLLSIPLLITVFSPRRWRRYAYPMAAVAPSPGYSPPPSAYADTATFPSSPAGGYASTYPDSAPPYASTSSSYPSYPSSPSYPPAPGVYPSAPGYPDDDQDSTRRL